MRKARQKGPASARLALANATLIELTPPRLRRATVLVEDGAIAELADAPPAGAEVIDCDGRWLLPAFVCAHTHLYSALARGMPPPREPPANFAQVLERVWWKLDRALDAEAVEASALAGALEAARAGCGTLVDHHASPGFIDGSLDVIGDALERVGLRGVLCYEVSDRGGDEAARAGVRENDRFLGRLEREPRPLLRGMVGAHAAFTLSDRTAEAVADVAARRGAGVHVHVAEDAIDARKGDLSTVAWLKARGLLGPRSLLAHAVHCDEDDVRRIVEAEARVVHNPRSNLNNAVGYARPGRFGDRVLIGTDGLGADVRTEAQVASLLAQAHRHPFDAVGALERNRALASFVFGRAFALTPGAAADLVVLDYRPPTPADEGNLEGHARFGLPGAPVRHLLVEGRPVIRDGAFTTVDEAALLARAQEVARRLWKRMR